MSKGAANVEAVFLDLETTGLNPPYDEVLQVGIVDDAGSVLMDTLVRPIERKHWPEAQEIHGIEPADVAGAPALAEVLPHLANIVRGKRVVIYNAAFDSAFLPLLHEVAAEVHCCMLAFSKHYGEWNDYYGNYRWQRLGTAAEYVLHELREAHDAVADAQACCAVYRYLNDPSERARVDALREQRRVIEEARRQKERIEWEARLALCHWEDEAERQRDALERAASAALMRRLGMPMYQPGREPPPRTLKEELERREKYAHLFFRMPLAVIEHEDRAGKTLPAYTKRTEIPDNLKAFNHFRRMPPWVRAELIPDAYVFTEKTFSWLYDVAQADAIRARHPLRRDYLPPQGYRLVTKTQLRKMGRKDAELAAMAPVIEVDSKYQGWIFMYEVPDA